MPPLRFAQAASEADDKGGLSHGRTSDGRHGFAKRAILLVLGGAAIAPVAFHKVVGPGEFQEEDAGAVVVDEDCVRDLPLQVDEPRTLKVFGQGGELGEQLREKRACRCAPVLCVTRTLIPQCQADAGQNSVMGRRDGVAESRATQHYVGCRLGRGATCAGAILLLTPFDKFSHSGQLPGDKANTSLSITRSQSLESAAKHVA